MRIGRSLVWLVILRALIHPVVTASDDATTTSTCNTTNNDNNADGTCSNNAVDEPQQTIECGVYMAPSTIGNYSNLGIFAGKTMYDGEVVPFGEILIPFLWRTFGKHPTFSLTDGQLWDRYIWEQYVGEMEAFDDLIPNKEKASCFFPGVGCTVNSMLDLTNIQSVSGSAFDEVVDRMTSPGAGAFTPYHSAETVIRVDQVEPGQELFASYGEEWIPWIPGVAVTKDANFDMADELMQEFEEWIEEHESPDCPTKEELTDDLMQAMWESMVDFPLSSRPLSVLPKEWSRESLKKAAVKETKRELGESETESPSREYWANKGMVSMDFLQKHGKCQDHIFPDISTIPDAGRGAFATRDLPKGTVVGYAPLVHVAIRGEEIYTINYDGKHHGNENNAKDPFARPDLVLNYSFGHRNSTLLLTPYGGMVNYINHKSASDGDGPNVAIRWPKEELVAHKPEWLDKDIYFLRDTLQKIGLSFDYVALRDIKQGEEVFMDYGDEWVSRLWTIAM
jgi:SET domain